MKRIYIAIIIVTITISGYLFFIRCENPDSVLQLNKDAISCVYIYDMEASIHSELLEWLYENQSEFDYRQFSDEQIFDSLTDYAISNYWPNDTININFNMFNTTVTDVFFDSSGVPIDFNFSRVVENMSTLGIISDSISYYLTCITDSLEFTFTKDSSLMRIEKFECDVLESSLTQIDKNYLLLFASVAKYSCDYWVTNWDSYSINSYDYSSSPFIMTNNRYSKGDNNIYKFIGCRRWCRTCVFLFDALGVGVFSQLGLHAGIIMGAVTSFWARCCICSTCRGNIEGLCMMDISKFDYSDWLCFRIM